MDLGVRDRSYVVFGGTRGMGLAAARVLVADGAAVALVGRDQARAEDAADELGALGDGHAVGLAGDLREPGEADRLIATAGERIGALRGVAVTTGLGMRGQRGLLEATDEDWEDTFSYILMGTVRACRAAARHLVEAGAAPS